MRDRQMSGKENSLTETWLMIQKVRACCFPPLPSPFLTNAEKLSESSLFIYFGDKYIQINLNKQDKKTTFTNAKQTGKGNKFIKLKVFP